MQIQDSLASLTPRVRFSLLRVYSMYENMGIFLDEEYNIPR